MVSRSPSRSEGELLSSDSDSKAIRPQTFLKDHLVDRRSRHDPAPTRRSRSRSRSPYRAPRGEKRSRQEDPDRAPPDSRSFNVRYEDDGRSRHRSREHRSKKSRTYSLRRSRSPSPFRHAKAIHRDSQSTHAARPGIKSENRRTGPSMHAADIEPKSGLSHQATANGSSTAGRPGAGTDDDTDRGARSGAGQVDTSAPALDETALIEARRKRREAIKTKYKNQEPSLLVQALRAAPETTNQMSERPGTYSPAGCLHGLTGQVSPSPLTATTSAPDTPRSVVSEPRSPTTPGRSIDSPDHGSSPEIDAPSAADYDPIVDMQDERARHERSMFKEDERAQMEADQKVKEQAQAAGQPSAELDMFADEDDMFAASPVPNSKPTIAAPSSAAIDNFDDPEGYYLTKLGEVIHEQYRVTQNLGRGMFASVVRAVEVDTDQTVAIKIIRNNDSMRKAGLKEIDILRTIAGNDPDDKMQVVRLIGSFDHRSHLCMVFENLSMNLREVLKKYGREDGISLKSIRAYATQLFRGLALLRKCQLLHADLKPDNILINESRSAVKICDLGSASPISDNAIAPYLVSRYYRAPEIILGMEYDYAIDMWSIGCTLFELYTGKILFTGRNNNNMLRTIMDCRGKFPNKLLRKGTLTYDYFDDLLNFKAVEPDKLTGKMVTKLIDIKPKPVRDLKSRLMPRGKRLDENERKDLDLYADLLDKCLQLSPEKRITPTDALRHAFLLKTK